MQTKVGDEVVVKCGRTKTTRKGVVRPFSERQHLSHGQESFVIDDDLIVVLGEVLPEEKDEEPVVIYGPPVLNLDFRQVYLPNLKKRKVR